MVLRAPQSDDSGRAQEFVGLLGRVGIFQHLDRVTLSRLAAHLRQRNVQDGEAVFRQGDVGDGVYMVARGRFDVFTTSACGQGEALVDVYRPGDSFGEMALLTDEPRSTTVRAHGAGEVLCLERGPFLGLLVQEPALARALAAGLSQRLKDARRALQQAGQPIALLEAHHAAHTPEPEEAQAPASAATRQGLAARPWWQGRRPIGLALAVVLLTGLWGLPPPPALSLSGWRALVALVAAVPLLALEALPDGVVALLLPTVWVLGAVATPQVSLGGFASAAWVLLVCVLAVGSAIASTGLLYRLALLAVGHAPGGFTGQVLALSLAGLCIGPAVPNATGRVGLIAPVATELVEALGYAPGSRPAAALALAAFAGFGQMAAPFLTSSTTAVLVYAVLPARSHAGLNWLTWAARALPTHLILLGGLVAFILWRLRPGPGESRAPEGREPYGLALQRALLGPPSRHERLALGVGLALLVGFVSQPLHGADPAWLAVLALAALASGSLVTADSLRGLNWSFALLFGTLAGMAGVFTQSGLDGWLAALVGRLIGGLTAWPALFVGALTLVCYAVSLVLRWQAAAPLLTIALGPVAAAAGIDPWVVALVALVACNTFFLPYQSTTYLALYYGAGGGSAGRLFTHRQARPLAIAYGVAALFALVASVPYWRWLGLIA